MSRIMRIFKVVRDDGPIKTIDIARKLNLSDRTVRHNLHQLCDEQLIRRCWTLGDTRITYYQVKP